MTVAQDMERMAEKAREASRQLAAASGAAKDAFLAALARLLTQQRAAVLAANAEDLDKARAAGLDAPRLNRLALTPAVMDAMVQACHEVVALPDPVGAIEAMRARPNGLLVGRMRVPLGCYLHDLRGPPPMSPWDAAILCLKAGNAVILKGGSEALASNVALAGLLRTGPGRGRPARGRRPARGPPPTGPPVTALCKLDHLIDVIIPRGGEGLIRAVVAAATMPVLKHYKGVCHIYVDAGADPDRVRAGW